MKPLTISFNYNGRTIDIIVKEDQRILDVMQVLKESQMLPFFHPLDQLALRSWRLLTFVNPLYTFKQAHIENGDILEFLI